MFKRTRGYVVLTLLIVTGLASQVSTPTISTAERKLVISSLKDSRKNFLAAVSDLSPAQINFKPSGSRSIREHCTELENYTRTTWTLAEASLQLPAGKDCDLTIKTNCFPTTASLSKPSCKKTCDMPAGTKYKTAGVTDRLKASQSELIRYAKTTTEDLHGHSFQTKEGKMDVYQAMLAIVSKTNAATAEINRLRSAPGFPKK